MGLHICLCVHLFLVFDDALYNSEYNHIASNDRINGMYSIGKNLEESGLEVPPQYSPDENKSKQGDICQNK
jgi:hypothetical protein